MSIVERVREIVEPLLARHSLEVYDVELAGSQLRITIDRPAPSTEGLDLDTIAQATRLVSLALDEHDPIDARYTLEVSSPGLERTLRTPAHFTRAVGIPRDLKTRPGVEGDRRVRGVLTDCRRRRCRRWTIAAFATTRSRRPARCSSGGRPPPPKPARKKPSREKKAS